MMRFTFRYAPLSAEGAEYDSQGAMRFAPLSAEGAEYDSQRAMRFAPLSAEGAEYDSQGQALSAAKRVAPGTKEKMTVKL